MASACTTESSPFGGSKKRRPADLMVMPGDGFAFSERGTIWSL
jgi:hypothetical protein